MVARPDRVEQARSERELRARADGALHARHRPLHASATCARRRARSPASRSTTTRSGTTSTPRRTTRRRKRIFGHRGRFTPDGVIDLCLRHPAHAPYICKKLWGYFIADAALGRRRCARWRRPTSRSRPELRPVLESSCASRAVLREPRRARPGEAARRLRRRHAARASVPVDDGRLDVAPRRAWASSRSTRRTSAGWPTNEAWLSTNTLQGPLGRRQPLIGQHGYDIRRRPHGEARRGAGGRARLGRARPPTGRSIPGDARRACNDVARIDPAEATEVQPHGRGAPTRAAASAAPRPRRTGALMTSGCNDHHRTVAPRRSSARARGARMPIPEELLGRGRRGVLPTRPARRDFLAGGVGTVLACRPRRGCRPGSCSRARSPRRPRTRGTILVTVYLSGGNDGLNTLLPLAGQDHSIYAPDAAQIALGSAPRSGPGHAELGWHPQLGSLKTLIDAARSRAFLGVDYPNPTTRTSTRSTSGAPGSSATAPRPAGSGTTSTVRLDDEPAPGRRGRSGAPTTCCARGARRPRAVRRRTSRTTRTASGTRSAVSSTRRTAGPARSKARRSARWTSCSQSVYVNQALKPLAAQDRDPPADAAAVPGSGTGESLRNLARMLGAGLGIRVATVQAARQLRHATRASSARTATTSPTSPTRSRLPGDLEARGLADRVRHARLVGVRPARRGQRLGRHRPRRRLDSVRRRQARELDRLERLAPRRQRRATTATCPSRSTSATSTRASSTATWAATPKAACRATAGTPIAIVG